MSSAVRSDLPKSTGLGLAAVPALLLALGSPDSQAGDLEDYGEYLSSECSTCHRLDAFEGGIPPLGHLPRDYFVIAMKEYRTGQRLNPAMVSVANSLNDEEIEALAAYYDALRRGSSD